MCDVSLQDLAGQLILARLLVVEKRPLSRTSLKKPFDVFSVRLTDPEVDALFEEALARLVGEGAIVESPFALTETGRLKALEFWRIDRVPARVRWEELKRDFLLPRIVGLSSTHSTGKDRSRAVIGAVLRKHHALPEEVDSDPESILHALAWRQLGIESNLPFTPEAVVSRMLLGSDKRATAAEVTRHLACRALDSTGKDLFPAALQRWIAEAEAGSPTDSHAPPHDTSALPLSRFAARALAAAESNSSGRFGTNKVFISHVWNSLRHDPDHSHIPLPQFKQRLLDAHRQGLLQLSRADLVERMPVEDLASSETNYFDAVFHFICLK